MGDLRQHTKYYQLSLHSNVIFLQVYLLPLTFPVTSRFYVQNQSSQYFVQEKQQQGAEEKVKDYLVGSSHLSSLTSVLDVQSSIGEKPKKSSGVGF